MGRPKKLDGDHTRDGKTAVAVYFEPEHHARLKTEAKARGVPLGRLIMERALGGTDPVADAISDDDLVASALPLIDEMIERGLLLLSDDTGTLITGSSWFDAEEGTAPFVFLSTDRRA